MMERGYLNMRIVMDKETAQERIGKTKTCNVVCISNIEGIRVGLTWQHVENRRSKFLISPNLVCKDSPLPLALTILYCITIERDFDGF